MTSVEYIKNQITLLVSTFNTIKCTYDFDIFDKSHTIEVVPSEFYNTSKEFYETSVQINRDFIDLFPNEGLFFIDDRDYVPIRKAIFEMKGKFFDLHLTYSIADFQISTTPSMKSRPEFMESVQLLNLNFIKEAFTLKINHLDIQDSNSEYTNLDIDFSKYNCQAA